MVASGLVAIGACFVIVPLLGIRQSYTNGP